MGSSATHSTPSTAARPPRHPSGTAKNETVRIEILSDDLHRLLESHIICAADLRCLDCASTHCVRRLCLKVCAKQLRGNDAPRPRRHIPHDPEYA